MHRCIFITFLFSISFFSILYSAEQHSSCHHYLFDGYKTYISQIIDNTPTELAVLYEEAKTMNTLLCTNKEYFKIMIVLYSDLLRYVTIHFAKDKLFTKENLPSSPYKLLLIDAISAFGVTFSDEKKAHRSQQYTVQRLLFDHINSSNYTRLANNNIQKEVNIAFTLMKRIRYFTALSHEKGFIRFTFPVTTFDPSVAALDAYLKTLSCAPIDITVTAIQTEIKRCITDACTKNSIQMKEDKGVNTFTFNEKVIPFYTGYLTVSKQ